MVQFIFLPQRDSDLRNQSFFVALAEYLVLLPFFLFVVLTFPVFVIFALGISFLLGIIKTDKVEKAQDDETVATRVVLSLPLTLLRDQPATAYVAVDWTKYIPHLFS